MHFLPVRNEAGKEKPTKEQQQAYWWKRPSCHMPTTWRESLEIQKASLLLLFFIFLLSMGITLAYQAVQKAKLPLICGSQPNAQNHQDPQLTSLPSRGCRTARSVCEKHTHEDSIQAQMQIYRRHHGFEAISFRVAHAFHSF